jgi:DNA repair ATPase RecN
MAVERQFIVKLLADPSGLIDDFKTIRGEADTTFGFANEKLLRLMPTFKLLTTAAAGVFGGLVAGAGLAVKAAAEAEAEQQRLAQILTTTGKASREQIEALNAQADALERVGVVSGGNITVLQSQLATFDLQADTIERLTPAIVDYVVAEKGAGATAEDFKAATNGLAQALNGQFGALTRVGFVLDEETKAMIENGTETERSTALVKVLNSTYGGFNQSLLGTTEGGMQAFRNSLARLQTDLGTALLPLVNAAVGVLAKFAQIAADNSRVVGVLAVAVGVFSGAILLLAGYLKLAAFQKRLMNDEFLKGILTMKTAEGQTTALGQAVKGLGKGLAVLAAAEGVFMVLNEIGNTSGKVSDQIKRTTVALNEFGDAGTGNAEAVVVEFSKAARAIQDQFRLGDVIREFGRDFQFIIDGVKVNIESADEAFRKFLDSDPQKAAQIVAALERQLAVTDPSSRSYKDLKDAVDRYRGSVNLTIAAQGGLTDELAGTQAVLTTTAQALAKNKLATTQISDAATRATDNQKQFDAIVAQLGKTSRSTTSAVDTLRQAKEKLKSATEGVESAQTNLRNSGERLGDATKGLQSADDALIKAQEKLAAAIRGAGTESEKGKEATRSLEAAQRSLEKANDGVTDSQRRVVEAQKRVKEADKDLTKAKEKLSQAIRGFGKDTKEGIAASRGLAAAQRNLTRANQGVAEAQAKVVEKERELAELRAKTADPDKIVDAEFGLEKSKLDVEEATLKVAEAEEDLAKVLADPEASPLERRKAELELKAAKLALRDAIVEVGLAEKELVKVQATGATADEVAEAERELEEAKLGVQDALAAQAEAVDALTEASENYRKVVEGIREGDKEFVTLSEAVVKAEEDQATAVRNLADANDAVKDALIAQETAQINLTKQKEEYRKVVEGLREDDEEFIELSKDVVKATDDQATAARNLRDAREGVASATKAVQDAEEELRLSRKELRVAGGRPPGRAHGGPVTAGRAYTVGEMGPELFVPASSGRIIPNNRMGGGITVNVVVNAGLGTSGIQVAQQIVDVLNQYTKVSGPLSQYVSV